MLRHRSIDTLALIVALLVMLGAGVLPVQAEETGEESEELFYESRAEIPLSYQWDVSAILADDEAFENTVAEVEAGLTDFDRFKGRLAESPQVMVEAMQTGFDLQRKFEDAFVYAHQKLNTDTAEPVANELAGKARSLAGKLQEATAFIEPEIAQLPEETLNAFLQDPAVKPYGHYIEDVVRVREHILSPDAEKILAGSSVPGAAHQQAFSTLVDAGIEWPVIKDEEGEDLQVVPGQYMRVATSDDRRVRREGSLALFGKYDQFAGVFAATLGGSIQRSTWLARTRGYESALEMALDGSNVPRTVVDTLVSTVNDNIQQLHKYASLRKELQALEEFHIYDYYVNLIPGIDKKYTFEQGWELAMEFWRETFGAEYAEVAERARTERWIDVYTNKGKRPGAYSWGTYNSHPYLLLNWGGDLESVSTLVHEMGHSIHSYMADKNQPYHDAGYSLFVAEVASVASESLFLEWLLQRSEDPDERKLLLNQAVNNITGTFVRQIFFHEWEAKAHAMAETGEPLTKESLGEAYGQLWKTYYGPDLVVDDAYFAGWSRISHYYRNFYVWVYATSYAAGEAIAARFRSGDEGAVQDYLAMLKLGGSVYPLEAVQTAGVDMTDPEVIRAVMDRYGELQERLRTELMTE